MYSVLYQFFIVRTLLCVTFRGLISITTTCFNWYYSLHSYAYNRDLQTTVIFFTRNVSSYKTDGIPPESPLLVLSFYISLMIALEWKYLCLRDIFINTKRCLLLFLYFVYVALAVLLLYVYLFIPFFILMLLVPVYFCLFVDHVTNPLFCLITPLLFSLILLITNLRNLV